jgi:hypothetical protein
MMPIAITIAVALFASTAFAAAPAAPAAPAAAIPPMVVYISAGAEVSVGLVSRICAEAEAIWRPAGVIFSWRRTPRATAASTLAADRGPFVPDTLRLTIGAERGAARDGRLPLGWIVFDAATAPQQDIYLSHRNARELLENAAGVVGVAEQMPTAQRDTLLARAMGRALAHELGHYLLASKEHSARGLMKAILTAVELFGPDASPLRLEPAQRRTVAARLRGEPLVASR